VVDDDDAAVDDDDDAAVDDDNDAAVDDDDAAVDDDDDAAVDDDDAAVSWTELTNALEAKVKKIAMKAETLYKERCNSVCEALSYHGCSKV
jgi:hypothetical protein